MNLSKSKGQQNPTNGSDLALTNFTSLHDVTLFQKLMFKFN